ETSPAYGTRPQYRKNASRTLDLSRRSIQPRVEVQVFLREERVLPDTAAGVEDQIPTPAGDGARNRHEGVSVQPLVSKVLLGSTERARIEPQPVGDVLRSDDMDLIPRDHQAGSRTQRGNR